MIVHLFNSSSISGPERLVLPALASHRDGVLIVNLREDRIVRLREGDPLEEYSRSLKLSYTSIRVRSRWDRKAIRELQQLLNKLHPAIIHAHSVKGSMYLSQARPAGRSGQIPIVSTHHGVHGLPDWKTRWFEWLNRKYSLRVFDRILSVSTSDYEFLLKSGIPKERLRLHLNGIQGRLVLIENRPKEAERIRARWLPEEADRGRLFLFGVVGRLSKEKDHVRLLRVLADLNRFPGPRDWKCLIFGTGDQDASLKKMSGQLGLQNRVIWWGYRKEVGRELAGLDLLLSFSKAEGLPINLIEAGWAGTPVMSTFVGGVKDLIPDETYGIRIPPDEPAIESARRIQKVLSDEGQAPLRAQSQRFQERVMNEFTQEKWMARLEQIYAELNVQFRESKERVNREPKATCN